MQHSNTRTLEHSNTRTPEGSKAPRFGSRSLIVIGILSLATWTACQKEDLSTPLNNNSTQQEDFDSRIAAFVAKAEHNAGAAEGDIRSTSSYGADSAAWYVEGALNYSLAQAWIGCNAQVLDSISINLPSDGGNYAASDVEAAYLSLYDSLETVIEPGVNHLILVDALPMNGNSGAVLKIHYILGAGYGKLGGLNTTYPVGTALQWMTDIYPTGNYSCSVPLGYSALGADKTMQGRVNMTIPLLAVGQYYASVEYWYVTTFDLNDDLPNHIYSTYSFPNPSNTSGDPTQDYAVWFCAGAEYCYCLDASSLTYHTQATYDMMHAIRTAQCPNKTPAHCNIQGDMPMGDGEQFMRVNFTYGIPQYRLNRN